MSSRWSFSPNSARGSVETTTIGTLDFTTKVALVVTFKISDTRRPIWMKHWGCKEFTLKLCNVIFSTSGLDMKTGNWNFLENPTINNPKRINLPSPHSQWRLFFFPHIHILAARSAIRAALFYWDGLILFKIFLEIPDFGLVVAQPLSCQT